MQLVPEDYEYDLTDDLQVGWQQMVIVSHSKKEIPSKNPSGNTVTYISIELKSAESETSETLQWSMPMKERGTRSRMGRLMKTLFPDREKARINEICGKALEVNLGENSNGFLEVIEVRPLKERTETKKRSK